jgi:hypothetical protein
MERTTEDYFALCLACHYATVATFVPTDVDSKIRGLLWRQARDTDTLRSMFQFAARASLWSTARISKRDTHVPATGSVGGHNGEIVSVLAGALGAFLRIGDDKSAAEAESAIDAELTREAVALRWALEQPGHELDVLRLAATLTHNAGDLDQGISFWPSGERYSVAKARFHRLAHENRLPYGGAFQIAAKLYRDVMASEGHRNYPLRAVRALRQSPDFLLPLSPFLDEWGTVIATHPLLTDSDRAETLGALLDGCRKIPGQHGYFRAIHGMADALGSRMDQIVSMLPASGRSYWKDANLRRTVSINRVSFESSMRKKVATIRPRTAC